MRLFLGQIVLAGVLLVAVAILAYMGGYPEYVLPSASTVGTYLIANWQTLGALGLYTFSYSCLGLMIAVIIAAASASATMKSKKSTESALALGVAWQSYPIVAIAPLLFVIFGDGQTTRIIIIVTFAYFPIFIAFLAVGSRRIEGLESFFEQIGHWPRGGRFFLRLNHSAMTIESAIVGGSALALVGAVVAEFLGANYGIGYLIRYGQYSHHTEIMLAAIAAIALFGACYFALVQSAVRLTLPGSSK